MPWQLPQSHVIVCHFSISMELDKRSCHWIVTVPFDAQPSDEDVNTMNAVNVVAKWSFNNKSLSIWYTFEHAQRASTLTNAFNENVVLKRCQLSSFEDFNAISFDWESKFNRQLPRQLPSTNLQYGGGVETLKEDFTRYLEVKRQLDELPNELRTIGKRIKHAIDN